MNEPTAFAPSLGLTGDLDDVDLIEDVEAVFDIRLSDAELEGCRTVGDLFDRVRAQLPADQGTGRCATSMTFYRLRRAIEPRIGVALRSATPIGVLAALPVRDLDRIIREDCGMRVASISVSTRACVGLVIVVLAALAAVPFGLAWWVPALVMLACTASMRALPLRLDADVESFGDLVRAVSAKNFGMLSRQGARVRDDDAWEIFRGVVSRHSDAPIDAIERGLWCCC